MIDFGEYAFELYEKLERDGWNPDIAKGAALSYARGGIIQVVADWWGDEDGHDQELCRGIIDWHCALPGVCE